MVPYEHGMGFENASATFGLFDVYENREIGELSVEIPAGQPNGKYTLDKCQG